MLERHRNLFQEARKALLFSYALLMLFLAGCMTSNVGALTASTLPNKAKEYASDFYTKWHTVGEKISILNCIVRVNSGVRILSAPDSKDNQNALGFLLSDINIYYPPMYQNLDNREQYISFTSDDLDGGRSAFFVSNQSPSVKKSTDCEIVNATITRLPGRNEKGVQGIAIATFRDKSGRSYEVGVGRTGAMTVAR